jgi:hypothetical protein
MRPLQNAPFCPFPGAAGLFDFSRFSAGVPPFPATDLTAVVPTVLAGKTILAVMFFFGFRVFVRDI